MGGQTGEIRGKEGMQIGKAGIRKEEGELLTTTENGVQRPTLNSNL